MKLYPLFIYSFSYNPKSGISSKFDVKPSSFAGSSNGHPACWSLCRRERAVSCRVRSGSTGSSKPRTAVASFTSFSFVYPVVVTLLSRKNSVNDFTVQLLKDFVESPDDVDAIKNILTKIRSNPQYRQMNAHRQYTSVRHKKTWRPSKACRT